MSTCKRFGTSSASTSRPRRRRSRMRASPPCAALAASPPEGDHGLAPRDQGQHGNVDTRLKRLKSRKTLDAIVLAAAGLRRLRREKDISFLLELGQMTPSAGQGAIALQTREDDAEAREAAAAISDEAALTEL